MLQKSLARRSALGAVARLHALGVVLIAVSHAGFAAAQAPGGGPIQITIDAPLKRVEMIVSTSRILDLGRNIPRVMVRC